MLADLIWRRKAPAHCSQLPPPRCVASCSPSQAVRKPAPALALRTGKSPDAWGPHFCRTLRLAAEVACKSRGVRVSWPCTGQLVVGTDCSGAEAPVWALNTLGLPHKHVFSCDVDPHVRAFIKATCPRVGVIFPDMLKRDHTKLPEHTVYICGFPCKSFSSLRQDRSRPLQSPHAKPFFAMLKVLEVKRPKLVVLENVFGIRTVLDAILKCLRRVKGYYVFVLPIDSLALGAPVSRPRMYFVLVRQDAARSKDPEVLCQIARAMHAVASSPLQEHVADLMLPSSSPLVRAFLEARSRQVVVWPTQRGRKRNGASGATRRLVFHISAHSRFQSDSADRRGRFGVRVLASCVLHKVAASGRHGVQGLPVPSTCFTSDRQVAVFRRALDTHGARDLVVDVSQSVHRAPSRCDGATPTLTPNAVVVVQRLGRVIMPIEKLLLHDFPIDSMGIPANTKDSVLSRLGGNTMHLKSVSLALLVGIALVEWGDASGVWGSGGIDSAIANTPPAFFPLGSACRRRKTRLAGKGRVHKFAGAAKSVHTCSHRGKSFHASWRPLAFRTSSGSARPCAPPHSQVPSLKLVMSCTSWAFGASRGGMELA